MMSSYSFNLQARANSPISQADEEEYERLVKLIIEGMKYAEKKFKKLKTGCGVGGAGLLS